VNCVVSIESPDASLARLYFFKVSFFTCAFSFLLLSFLSQLQASSDVAASPDEVFYVVAGITISSGPFLITCPVSILFLLLLRSGLVGETTFLVPLSLCVVFILFSVRVSRFPPRS